ncbi:ribonuclease H-like domain-containing protein [Trichococcus shcherbakoviae]|uniref:ribonuclease H-like domain-containing protein n=1 Tax=Trichococcus shcherbakoviae TaxID=2094020 RepID=UPI002AA71DDE|nr:ribonuclease H-like domain-containing protein [Trichococcus shcherbakoviae]
MKYLAFDIETGPLPWEQVASQYSPPAAMLPWDDSMVKYGNAKDPAKRKEKYDQVKAAYEAELAKETQTLEAARLEWYGKAALSPMTGRVLAIGIGNDDAAGIIGTDGETEEEILAAFWEIYKKFHVENTGRLVGFNIKHFDVPFMVRRSWFHGIPVPESLIEKGRYLSPTFIDLMIEWGVGGMEMVKLDTLAKFFGIGGKPEGVDGGMFSTLWESGNEESRKQAVDYLLNDIDMTWRLAERMGVVA